jgi:hypothetical protein
MEQGLQAGKDFIRITAVEMDFVPALSIEDFLYDCIMRFPNRRFNSLRIRRIKSNPSGESLQLREIIVNGRLERFSRLLKIAFLVIYHAEPVTVKLKSNLIGNPKLVADAFQGIE